MHVEKLQLSAQSFHIASLYSTMHRFKVKSATLAINAARYGGARDALAHVDWKKTLSKRTLSCVY